MEDSKNNYLLRWEQLKTFWVKIKNLISSSVKKETDRAKEVEGNLSSALEEEVSRATTSENALSLELEGEMSRAIERENDIESKIKDSQGALDREILRATAAESTNSNNIALNSQAIQNEIDRAEKVEDELRSGLENVYTKPEIDSRLNNKANVSDVYDKNSIDLFLETKANQSDLVAEVSRSTAEDAKLSEGISEETNRATQREDEIEGKITGILGNLQGEIERATAEEKKLDSKISSETERAIQEETRIEGLILDNSGKLKEEINRATEEETRLGDFINSEVTRATEEETRIEGKLDNFSDELSQEIERAKAAEGVNAETIATEINRAKTREDEIEAKISDNSGDLQKEIDRATQRENEIDSKVNTISEDLKKEISRAESIEFEIEAKVDDLSVELNNEISRATQEETSLWEAIREEVLRAESKESFIETSVSDLTRKLDSEISRAIEREDEIEAKISDNSGKLEEEIRRATEEESRIEGLVSTEQSRAESKELELNNKISSENERAITREDEIDSKVTNLKEKLDQEISRATQKEIDLDSKIATETQRATQREDEIEAKISDNSGDLRKEIDRATSAEENLQNQITETKGDLTSEISRATQKEKDLEELISTNAAEIQNKADNTKVVHIEGTETITGEKTFTKPVNFSTIGKVSEDTFKKESIVKNSIILPNGNAIADYIDSKNYLTSSDISGKADRIELTAEIDRATKEEKRIEDLIKSEASTRLSEDGKLLALINNHQTSSDNHFTEIETTIINNLKEAKEYVDSKATGAMKWKGVVDDLDSFPSNPEIGDFWTVREKDNSEYAWNGENWYCVGTDVDFSEIREDIKSNTSKITSEITRATRVEEEIIQSISGINSSIQEETERAKNKEIELEGVVSGNSQKISELESGLAHEINRATSAEETNANDIANLSGRLDTITSEVSTLSTELSNEVTRAEGKEQELENKISELGLEVGQNTNSISGLREDLLNEISRATDEEQTNASNISALGTELDRIIADLSQVSSDLSGEISRAKYAEESLENNVNDLYDKKADKDSVYTKFELDTWLEDKADKSNTVTIDTNQTITGEKTFQGSPSVSLGNASDTYTNITEDSHYLMSGKAIYEYVESKGYLTEANVSDLSSKANTVDLENEIKRAKASEKENKDAIEDLSAKVNINITNLDNLTTGLSEEIARATKSEKDLLGKINGLSGDISTEQSRAKTAEKKNADAITDLENTKVDKSSVYTKDDINTKVSDINTTIGKKADDSKVVHLTGAEDISGTKTFTGGIVKVGTSQINATNTTTEDRARFVAGNYNGDCIQINAVNVKDGDSSFIFSEHRDTWVDYAKVDKSSDTTASITGKTNTLVTGKAVESWVSGKGYATTTSVNSALSGKANSSDLTAEINRAKTAEKENKDAIKDLSGKVDINTTNISANTTALTTKADDSAVVHKTGNETVAGTKTFTSGINLDSNGGVDSTKDTYYKTRLTAGGTGINGSYLEICRKLDGTDWKADFINRSTSGVNSVVASVNAKSDTITPITDKTNTLVTGKAVESWVSGKGYLTEIADGSITTSKIKNGAVTTDKILDGNVTTAKLKNGSVTAEKIADGILSAKADDSGVVHKAGTEEISGTKTFTTGFNVKGGGGLTKASEWGSKSNITNGIEISAGTLSNSTASSNGKARLTVLGRASTDSEKSIFAFEHATNNSSGVTQWNKYGVISEKSKSKDSIASTSETFPNGKAVYDYVTSQGYITGIADGTITEAKLNKTLSDKINAKAKDTEVVHLTGDESISGVKSFQSSPTMPVEGSASSNKANISASGNYLMTGKAIYDYIVAQAYAVDSGVVHKAGTETITGSKTFSYTPSLSGTTIAGANKSNITSTSTYLVAGKAVHDYVEEKVTALNTSISGVSTNLENEIKRAKEAESTKAPQSTTYTKTEVNNLLSPKATTSALNTEISDRKKEITRVEGLITSTAATTLGDAKKYADSLATGAMIWKGVTTWAKLPTTGQRIGDFYTISDEQNKEYAWDGTKWMCIGADVDFSAMQTTISNNATAITTEKNRATSAESTLQTNINAKANSKDVYDKTTADGRFQAKGTYLTAVPDNSVTTVKIYAGAVTTAKIADANVTEAKLSKDLANKINGKANDSDVVKLSGDQSIAGTKTFSNSPVLSTTTGLNSADKAYVNSTSTTLMAGKGIYDYIEGKGFATTASINSALSGKANTTDLTSLTTKVNTNTTNISKKADDSVVVKTSGNQTVGGVKTFSSSPKLSTTTGLDSANKDLINSTSTTLMAGKGIYDYIEGKGFATTVSVNSALSGKANSSDLNAEITRAKAEEKTNADNITTLTTTVNGKAADSAVIHKAGAEEFTGTKTFTNLDLKSGGGLAKTTGWGSKTNITNGLEISAGTQHNTTATSNGKARFTMLGRGSTDAEKSIFAFEHTTNNSSGVTQWNRYGVITEKSKSKDSIASTSETFPNGKAVYDYVAGQVSTLNASIGNKANSADVYTKTQANSTFQAKGTYLTSIADGSITTAKIKDANVTEAKLDSTLATKINGKVNSNAAIPRRTDKTDYTRIGCTNFTAYDESTDNPANASSTIANSSWYFITGKAAKAYMDANYTKTSGVVTLANSQTITGTKKFDGGIDLYSESNFRNLSTWNGKKVRGYSTTIKPASGDTGTSQGIVYHAIYQTSNTDAEFYIDHGINVKQSDGTYKFTRYGIIDKNSNSPEAINQSFEDLVTGKAVKTYLTESYNTKSNTVNTTGDQSIAGTKTFTSTVNIGATSGNYVQADTNRYGRYASSGSYLNGYYMGSNFLDLEYNGSSSYLRVSADSKTASTAIKSGSTLVPSGGAVYSYINSWQANTSNIKDNAITTAKMALGNSTWYPVWGTANTRVQLLSNMNYNMVLIPSGFGLIKPSSAAGGDCIIVNNGTSVAVPVYNASTGSGIWFTIPGKCTAIMHHIAEWDYTIKPDICTPVGVKITDISALQATWYSLNSSNYIYTTTTSPAGHTIFLPPYGVEGDIVEVFGVFETEVPKIHLFINNDIADSSTVVKKITAWQNVKGLDLKALWVNGKWNIIRRDVSVSQTDIEEVAPGPNVLYLKESDVGNNYVFNIKDCLFQDGTGIIVNPNWSSSSGTRYLIALDKEYDIIIFEGGTDSRTDGFGNSTYTNPLLYNTKHDTLDVSMIVPMGTLCSNGNANGPTNTSGKIKKFSNGYTVKLIGIKIGSETWDKTKYILHNGNYGGQYNRFREYVHWREFWFDSFGY